VDVAAYLPPRLLSHLKVVLGQGHTLIPATGWAELLATVNERIVDIVVADPATEGNVQVAELEELMRQFPSLPVVVYTVLAPLTLKGVVRLAQSGVEHVVLNRFDDDPARFLELLELVPGHALGERMLQELAEPLSALPVMVCRAIEQLYRYPLRFRTAQDLAAAAGMTHRTLYRNLEPVGLHSPRMLVMGSRLLRAYSHLRDPGRNIKDIASKAGFSSPWQLTKQMREATGLTPEEIRRKVEPEVFVGLLAREVLRDRRVPE
jgi:AraC-like DNA-binding protein